MIEEGNIGCVMYDGTSCLCKLFSFTVLECVAT